MKRLLVAAIAAAAVIAPAAPARADDGTWTGCAQVQAITQTYTSQDGGYWYTLGYNVPYSWESSCNDISVGNSYSGAFQVRTRFYLSNGTNYANSWKTACSLCWAPAATDVLNGTHFRLEFREWEHITIYY